MNNINAHIQEKLENYPEDVQQLALEALEQAERMPETSLSQYLEGVVRKQMKNEQSNEKQEGQG